MLMLRDLLTTWENWSARDTLTRALHTPPAETATPAVSALDAQRDSAELVELLAGGGGRRYTARAVTGRVGNRSA